MKRASETVRIRRGRGRPLEGRGLEPRAALELLGKLTEGASLVEAHAVAKSIRVMRPTRDEPSEVEETKEEHE